MIEAKEFVDRARARGFVFWTGVPCSFLTPLIDCVIGHPRLSWVSSANEGDAVATASGAVLGGQRAVAIMQNSGLGNAVNPLASLTHTLRIPVLLIATLRGDPALRDEPQHELMGTITERLLEELRIPWEYFPKDAAEIEPALGRACGHLDESRRPFAFIMRKGSVAGRAEGARSSISERHSAANSARSAGARRVTTRPSRAQALRRIVEATPEDSSLVIATTGYTGRELSAIADRPNQLYVVGSMGCASSLALGVSLARDSVRVVVVDGDGAALMRMGNFATLGTYGGDRLVHVVLDNESHESTGGQPTVSSGISFAGVAAACGYGLALEGEEIGLLDQLFAAEGVLGPRFAALKIRPDSDKEPPRPRLSPESVCARFSEHVRRVGGVRELDGLHS
jgi:phosphonopyruvate decarboxylase